MKVLILGNGQVATAVATTALEATAVPSSAPGSGAGDKADTAFYIIVGPAAGGETPVDYIWTKGG